MTSKERLTPKNNHERDKQKYPSYLNQLVAWHESLARVGIEKEVDLNVVYPDKLKRLITLKKPTQNVFSVPTDLWSTKEFEDARSKLAQIYHVADSYYSDLPYLGHEYLASEIPNQEESANTRGARASYFALNYLGITDPAIHTFIRFHNYGLVPVSNTALIRLKQQLTPLIRRGVIPRDMIEMITTIDGEEARVNKAIEGVINDTTIPPEIRLGVHHTPQTLWELYKHVTSYHTSDVDKPTDKFLSPLAMYSGAQIEANAYRRLVARVAILYEDMSYPNIDLSPVDIQSKALSILMEMWPIARGLDESVLSRYTGDCIGKGFMPKEYANLAKAATNLSPEKVEIQRLTYATWMTNLLSKLPQATHFVSGTEAVALEYAYLIGTPIVYKPYEVMIPGDPTTEEHMIDVKTRSSAFWKMIEIINDPEKMQSLVTSVKDKTFGSEEFWRETIKHMHDIYRSQLIFLGPALQNQVLQSMLAVINNSVLSPDNCARQLYGERDIAVFQLKESDTDGTRVNAIFTKDPQSPNFELQIKDLKAFMETVINPSTKHHIAYKLRYISRWRNMNPSQILTMVEGGCELRKRYLEMTYGLGLFPRTGTQGVVFRRNKI